ncbi:M48 family metalloprotease [Ideonella sp. A 288]|uniref:M48 family metalloprotease n=1 Tax=Ideonella sp. A 288 TaxID=1962181 RepID=UPI000B4AC23B|nr:M48 family metalloprotease [Ideonella sp. A 288]
MPRHTPPRPTRRARRPLCATLALSLLLGMAPAAHSQPLPDVPSQVRLPALGESASDDFNLSTEKRLGEQIMREIRRDPDYLDDPELMDYLQSVWGPLVAAARQRGDIGADVQGLFPFEAFLVRDRSVNAFALPGGFVGVHLGLIAMTSTRDELASVLAHELSHVSQRHIARSVTASQRSSTLGLAALILGVLAASRSSSPDAAQAAIAGSQAAVAQSQLNFSRDMEREADRTGQALMAQAGFAPSGMAAMFSKLDNTNRLNDNGAFPYLRSHPLTIERIGEAQQRAAQSGAGGAGSTPESLRWHALMQARARVLMDPGVDSARRLQDLDRREGGLDERLAGLYASGLASMALRDFTRAAQVVATAQALPALQQDGPARRVFSHMALRLALARSDRDAALRALAAMEGDRSRSAMLLRAQVALVTDDEAAVRRSAEALQTWVAERRLDALAWQQLAHCAERLGQPLRSVRASAEAQAALGDLPGAIDRLRAGQQLARKGTVGGDFIDASVIDARLRELQAQRRELMADQRGGRGNRGDAPE